MEMNELRFLEQDLTGARIAVVAFGTAGRLSQTAIRNARSKGAKVGLLRPISLNPFPLARLKELASEVEHILVVEMNTGQMLGDVRLAVEGRVPVSFYGRTGVVVPMLEEIEGEIMKLWQSLKQEATC